MTLNIDFDNSYARLPGRLFVRQEPTPVDTPRLIALNDKLAIELGLDVDDLRSDDGVATLAGNKIAPGSDPIAQAYAGHQFGGWSPQLGDGRAHLLGEVENANGQRRDIQLKGSGPTPFSRRGDGRAWLGPVLREYVVSEAMHALGVPTTRALAAVSTGEIVYREGPMPGAVLTRIAASHIRVGTFQYLAARQDVEGLRALMDHAIWRHFPEAATAVDPAMAFLKGVIEAQANLVAAWMSYGFIHGVMNTDNTTVSGETIDYGPCAFMDGYHPTTVYSSIDTHGRYAYRNQPNVLIWNLAQLGGALLPLMAGDQETAAETATGELRKFSKIYETASQSRFCAKLGLAGHDDGDAKLAQDLLDLMGKERADFTNTFRALSTGKAADEFIDQEAFSAWNDRWNLRRGQGADDAAMARANPAVIPRNHRIEEVIVAGVSGDFAPFKDLARVLQTPFECSPNDAKYTRPPEPGEEVKATFCGT